MKFCGKVFCALAVFALAARADEDDEKSKPKEPPVAIVRTVALKHGTIASEISAYGIVAAPPSASLVASAPFECRVTRLLVAEGQRVEANGAMVEVEPSPDSQLLLDTAKSALDSARIGLTNAMQRFALRLATNQDVIQAQQAFRDAELRHESLKLRGLGGGPVTVRVPVAGIVNKLDVQPGALVASGAALGEISGAGGAMVKLGIEPSDAADAAAGKKVSIRSVARSDLPEIGAQIASIAASVDADSGLVSAFASLPKDHGLLLGERVEARIETASKEALLAPRAAALPEEGHYVVFTVKDKKAWKHEVKLGIQNDAQVEIAGGDLKEGDEVVLMGNYELTDGMAVENEADRQDEKKSKDDKDEKKADEKPDAKAGSKAEPVK